MSEGAYKRNDHKIHEESLGKIVLVRLKGEKKLRGKLKGFDQHLNLVLEETEDITNAKKGRKLDPKPIISIPNLYPLSTICPEGEGSCADSLKNKKPLCVYFSGSRKISAIVSEGVLFAVSAFVLSFPIKSASSSTSSFSVDKIFTLY